ncbi:LysR family transcriptional regulator [Blastococcus sp. VKM Ac-2987]|uniref:LysR family transcriptional regulator n=1 Tax=Blastococcus sp. VKM Ac-2987 TaxID=3004141 RepID=UPI0022AB7613|nr:LysR family transcriptional regulator [Blastococcus sp. VKM Ac-2987]MCZ2860748.1 LysR family transcriptional regulator [Blastococcus sp. VKM Ac-2987]
METRVLFWFQQIADGATVTQVAELEHTTQPGISRALARLESELGTPLLRRDGRTLRMTHAGVAFKRHVDAVLHELGDGLAAVHQLVDPETGTVTLSFQPSLGTWLVPDLVSSFRAAHPAVGFDLRPKRDEHLTDVRERSDVDLELSTSRPRGGDVRWRGLVRQPLLLAVPEGHRAASLPSVALAELAGDPFVVIRPSSSLRPLSDGLCAAAGFTPAVAFECDDLPTMRAFVSAGLGVAIVPAMPGTAGGVEADRCAQVPISDAGAFREVGVAWSPERRLLPAAEMFLAHVLDRAAAGLLAAPDYAG